MRIGFVGVITVVIVFFGGVDLRKWCCLFIEDKISRLGGFIVI